jgi:hypothetical protein
MQDDPKLVMALTATADAGKLRKVQACARQGKGRLRGDPLRVLQVS